MPSPRPTRSLPGQGEAEAGTFTVCPVSTDPCTLAGISLSQVRVSLPYVIGRRRLRVHQTAKGTANGGSSVIDLLAGTPSARLSCSACRLNCDGAKADASADNDTGTAPPDTDQEGPLTAAAPRPWPARPQRHPRLGQRPGPGHGRSCWACQASGSPPRRRRRHAPVLRRQASGPASLSVGLGAGFLAASSPDRCCRFGPAAPSTAPRSPSTGTTAAAPPPSPRRRP